MKEDLYELSDDNDNNFAETEKQEKGKEDFQSRLAFGIKATVSKKEMHALTQKNYSQLPEIQKKNQKEKKRQEFKQRQQKVKELSQKVRNNLLFKVPEF